MQRVGSMARLPVLVFVSTVVGAAVECVPSARVPLLPLPPYPQ